MKTKNKSKPIDPFQYALSGSEDAEQIALFMWAQQNLDQYPELRLMFAIPNGMHTPNKKAAGRMRAMGMKRGVPDIFLPISRGEFHGLFVELKKKRKVLKNGNLSQAKETEDDQDEWIDDLKQQGYGAIACYGFEEAVKIIVEYLNYKRLEPVTGWNKMTEQDKVMFKG